MKHSDRVRWLEAAWPRLRAEFVGEAPADVTLTMGFPSRKRSGKGMCIGECAYDCIRSHGGGFGAEHFVTIHPILAKDPVEVLACLLHEMIHVALADDPTIGHGKQFQVIAKRCGLVKPWTATTPDDECAKKLQGIGVDVSKELGFALQGYYELPKPRPRKPSTSRKLRCACETPRTLTLTASQLDMGSILCGNCHEPFRIITPEESAPGAGSILIAAEVGR